MAIEPGKRTSHLTEAQTASWLQEVRDGWTARQPTQKVGHELGYEAGQPAVAVAAIFRRSDTSTVPHWASMPLAGTDRQITAGTTV